ncbi:ATP-binding protein [Frateuria hangzhouensis]|uniref:ATP-binding protein n=1 Tax=Frateuria hangzhouensis TaxID=2995589 RepID=UPI002260BEDE|nr:winged helix-turn-helix domain-containing protein [Frateuria sp. STR12]MCX7512261.1 winged helix-turn-helix domain-containing protein [Frateuria sp. STR12]
METPSTDLSDSSPPPRDAALASAEVRWRFGSFVVWETQRRLESFGQPVRLGPRSFDLLLQLLKHAGELVSKEALLSTVWAGVVVEESSVRVHMSLLRKALGEPAEGSGCKEWITTVPLKGYRFNGRVLREQDGSPASSATRTPAPFTRPPVRLTGLVGREADVESVLALLDAQRLVSIIGPGGIGKTSVAIRVAERWQLKPDAQVAFADLSPLISPDHVVGTMARSLGVAADLPDPLRAITESLTGRQVLLLVDNCEHVLDSLALPVTRLLAALPGLRVLATSREALRVSGECVLRLSPLAVPDAEGITLAQALRWPSVALLVDRARAAGAAAFNESHGPLLARISRQLDGIPLAIELVAARLSVQSVGDLAPRLDDHLRLLSFGNRAAQARHRTLAAALDWSIALLDQDELRVFRRLSAFRGRFDVEAALGVTAGDMDPDVAFDALISLANKSLVSFDSNDPIAPYRLLDTTRSYAAALLAQSGERPAWLRRHAMFMLDLMKRAREELSNMPEQAWMDRYAHHLDDVRFALGICLVEQADASLAAALATASAPLWFQLSQVEEFRCNIVAALAMVEQQLEPDPETVAWLNTALITALLHTAGPNEELDAACDRALAGALQTRVPMLELRARWGRCTHDMFRGAYAAALRQSDAMLAFAQAWAEPSALVLAHRTCAMANHFCGRLETSRRHSTEAIAAAVAIGRTQINMVGPDAIVAANALLCRTLWLQGETTKALQAAGDAVARAQSLGHSVSLCSALYGACAVALWSGNHALARQWIPLMREEAQRKGLLGWLRYADWFAQGLRLVLEDDRDRYVREVSDQLATCEAPHKEMLVTLCIDWLDDQLVERIANGEGLWCAAEIRRAVGWRSERRGVAGEAEDAYLRALQIARQQGARAWERRAALSLARMWAGSGRAGQAAKLLDEAGWPDEPDSGSQEIAQLRMLRAQIARRPAAATRNFRKVAGTPCVDSD